MRGFSTRVTRSKSKKGVRRLQDPRTKFQEPRSKSEGRNDAKHGRNGEDTLLKTHPPAAD